MEENKEIEDEVDNKKPLNIVLLGEPSSEKEKLISKFVLLNTNQFNEDETKKEEDKEDDDSLLQNINYCVEMHGEKVKMKLWDNPLREEFLSPSIKIAQGILLFYSVKHKQSFETVKNILSKIIELGRFDIPIVIIGNHSNTNEREISYNEVKTFADNYALRLYETSIDNDDITLKQILQDIGEQLLFQECINTANNSRISDDDKNINEDDNLNLNIDDLNLDDNLNIGELIENKNKEKTKSSQSNKNIRQNFNKDYSNLTNNSIDNSSVKKMKSNKQISKFNLFNSNSTTNLTKNKKKINLRNKKSDLNQSGSLILNNKNKSSLTQFSSFNLLKKKIKKSLNNITLPQKSNQNVINSSLSNSASSSNIHSYLKKTAITKNREKETQLNKIKMEKEFQSVEAQRERESIEFKKKKSMEDKEILIKKLKEDKIVQKEKEKYKKEEQIKNAKNNYEKIKKEKEEITKEIKIEKEKEKKNKIINKQNEKEKINKKKKEINDEREKEIKNVKLKKEKDKERGIEIEKKKEKLKEEKEKEIEKEKVKIKEAKILKEKENEEKLKQIKNKNKEKINAKISQKDLISNINKATNTTNNNNNTTIKSKNNPPIKLQKDKDKDKEKEKEKEKVKKNDENEYNVKNEKEIIDENEDIIILNEKEKELINETQIKNEIKTNFLKNTNIFRCLKCNLIPKIIINEYNQEIEVFCNDSYHNNIHHNIATYNSFQIKSLNHSIKDNIFCNYCKESLSQLSSENMLYYCSSCLKYYCTKDELNHINQMHQNGIEIKNNYKSIYENNNKLSIEPLMRRSSIGKMKNIINNNIRTNAHERRLSFKMNISKYRLENKIKDSKDNKEIRDDKDNKDNKENKEISNLEIKENNNNYNTKDNNNKLGNNKKIPIYLMDTYCFIHNKLFNSYCHDCNKNICIICQKNEHRNHLIEKFDDLFLNEDEINKKKYELNDIKDNLLKINDYFMALIEAIKCKFEKLYKAKQKEIEIKEKIINDYEIIKYNYNCIMNIKNLNINKKQSFINVTNDINLFNRLNLIFEYLNSSLFSEKNGIFKNMDNNTKIDILNFKNEKIKNIFKLDNNDFGISNKNGELKIYDSNKFREKLKIKLFDAGEGINNILNLGKGLIACCGYEKIKFVQLKLFNESYFINKIFEEKYNNFYSLIDYNNNYFISSGTKKLQIWDISENKTKKNNINAGEEEINILYKILPLSFIGCSYKNKKIIKCSIMKNNEIKLESKLDNISIVKGNHSLLNISNIILICYQDQNEGGIIIINNNNFEIITKIKNINPFSYINLYEKEFILTIDKKGMIQKWKYVENDKKLYEMDKINHPLSNDDNVSINNKLQSFISINKNLKNIFLYKNNIVFVSN